jgi:hypothetical protein
VQVPTPGQIASDQPEKTDPDIGVAVNTTNLLVAYDSEQVAPQLIPLGMEVTVPVPEPALVTVSVNICANVAVTDLAAFIVTVQEVLVPIQSPDQLENIEPVSGVAVNVTDMLLAYEAEQVAPQSISVGVEVTMPVPDPALVTVSVSELPPKDSTPSLIPLPSQPEIIIRRRIAVTEFKKDSHEPEATRSAPHRFALELFCILLDRGCVFISVTPY